VSGGRDALSAGTDAVPVYDVRHRPDDLSATVFAVPGTADALRGGESDRLPVHNLPGRADAMPAGPDAVRADELSGGCYELPGGGEHLSGATDGLSSDDHELSGRSDVLQRLCHDELPRLFHELPQHPDGLQFHELSDPSNELSGEWRDLSAAATLHGVSTPGDGVSEGRNEVSRLAADDLRVHGVSKRLYAVSAASDPLPEQGHGLSGTADKLQ